MHRLTDHRFSTRHVAYLAGVPTRSIFNWESRDVFRTAPVSFAGRRAYSLIDAIRLRVMGDLTNRAGLGPSDAAGAAELVARTVLAAAPTDADGHPLLDPNSIPQTRAFALTLKDGQAHVGLVDSAEPGGYLEWQGEWGRAHVVLPIAPLLAALAFRMLSDDPPTPALRLVAESGA